jgi:predicted XRE-type DNA-binding protein
VAGWSLTQGDAAARIGVTQSRLNDHLRGRIDRFSLDAPLNLARAAGLSVVWSISRLPADSKGVHTSDADLPEVHP